MRLLTANQLNTEYSGRFHIIKSYISKPWPARPVQMMGHLMAVKDKQATADTMFEPLKSTIELLKTYGQELNDDVHLQVQVSVLMGKYTEMTGSKPPVHMYS